MTGLVSTLFWNKQIFPDNDSSNSDSSDSDSYSDSDSGGDSYSGWL